MIRPATTVVTLGYGVYGVAGYTAASPHAGVDFSYSPDDNIYAPEDAEVTFVGELGTAGQATDLVAGSHKHRMCHQSAIYVSVGQRVTKGQVIGKMGDTGYAFGKHLHWVMWVNGSRVNGLDYVNEQGGDVSQLSIDESDVGVLRITHSEIGGWPLHDTHAGKFDQLFVDTYRGKSYGELIWAQWTNGQAYRDVKQAHEAFFAKYSAIIGDLEGRPTRAQLDEALAKLEAEAANVKVVEKIVEKTVYTHDEATAQAVQETLKTTKSIRGSLSYLYGYLKKKLGL